MDEDGEEELKEGEKSEKRELFGEKSEKSQSDPSDQIDEILSKSDKYEAAVNQNRLFGQASTAQAEPSHFHLAVVEKERLKNSTQIKTLDSEISDPKQAK